ncbi:general secretion pathway protein I [Inhella inkyongensis]|uniref:Type II secretion system protein I n=1 Tax=Inhella inkyongensis TaxID=392593 RepID=A0A840S436_9BURK|nr:type II secretion system minor pseudopilin GspI [Inhella inkyongensis]MBB5203279.1 general secretion pathway protein I [Inhella inkyongensis]
MKARGFTLIEVLVALAVVALALGAGMKAAGALTMNADRLQRMTAAQWCAENQLVELRLTKQFPGVGESSFSCEQLGLQFRGLMRVQPTPNPNFRRIDTVVGDETTESLLTLTTIQGRF